MAPTLIVLGLLALGVAIVAFATRRPTVRPIPRTEDQDTAWAEPAPEENPPVPAKPESSEPQA